MKPSGVYQRTDRFNQHETRVRLHSMRRKSLLCGPYERKTSSPGSCPEISSSRFTTRVEAVSMLTIFAIAGNGEPFHIMVHRALEFFSNAAIKGSRSKLSLTPSSAWLKYSMNGHSAMQSSGASLRLLTCCLPVRVVVG